MLLAKSVATALLAFCLLAETLGALPLLGAAAIMAGILLALPRDP